MLTRFVHLYIAYIFLWTGRFECELLCFVFLLRMYQLRDKDIDYSQALCCQKPQSFPSQWSSASHFWPEYPLLLSPGFCNGLDETRSLVLAPWLHCRAAFISRLFQHSNNVFVTEMMSIMFSFTFLLYYHVLVYLVNAYCFTQVYRNSSTLQISRSVMVNSIKKQMYSGWLITNISVTTVIKNVH